MQLPTPLYEALPAAYVLGGLAVALTHPEPMPFVSGLTLTSAGLAILLQRLRFRSRRRGRRQDRQRLAC